MRELITSILTAPDVAHINEIIFKLLLAVLLSGVLGFERESRGRAAGLRTHIIVCLGATILMIVSGLLADEFNRAAGQTWLDRGRIAAGIITGIGFLGAGTIVHTGFQQRGLTTAAMIWLVAALGVAVGCGYYLTATVFTAFTLVIIVGLRVIERRLTSHEHLILHLKLPASEVESAGVEARIRRAGAKHVEITRARYNKDEDAVYFTAQVDIHSEDQFHAISNGLRADFAEAMQLDIER